jgi:pimeloyl-ACP methyl ester carboxylesterase
MMPNLNRDGVRLAYEEAGSGGPPMLFVHGWGGDRRHFAPQMEHFKRSRRVVAIDRRGHGESDKPEGPYGIPAIAEEVAWTARELGLHKPIIVVHSMGAIGLELCSQYPELASALIVLDAPAFPPPEVRDAFTQILTGLRTPHYRNAVDATCDRLIFLPTDDKARRAALHGALVENPQHILVSTWEGFLAYDPVPAATRCKLPLLYIGGVMPFDEAKMRQACPQIIIGRAAGSGHFIQLEVPDQVNAMIDRFLEITPLALSAVPQARSAAPRGFGGAVTHE